MYTDIQNQHHHRNQLLMMRDSVSSSGNLISDSGVDSGSSPELNSSEEPPMSRTHQYRKVMKPMLERKRRARINKCLDEIKDIMVNTLQAEGESITKLEKADVLELTVKHLRKLKRKNALGLTPQATYAGRFRAGYSHCAQEVSKFMTHQNPTSVDSATSARLLSHLANCLHTLDAMPPSVMAMAMSPIASPPSISSTYSNTSYQPPMMSSPFSTSSPPACIPRRTTSPLTPNESSNSYPSTMMSPVSSIREKPLDLIKEKENQEAQDLSLHGAKQRLPLSLRSPSDANIKRSKSSSPPTSFKHDNPSSWRPW